MNKKCRKDNSINLTDNIIHLPMGLPPKNRLVANWPFWFNPFIPSSLLFDPILDYNFPIGLVCFNLIGSPISTLWTVDICKLGFITGWLIGLLKLILLAMGDTELL